MNRKSRAETLPWFELVSSSMCLSVPVLNWEYTVCDCLFMLNLGTYSGQHIQKKKRKTTYLFRLSMWPTSYSPSVSAMVPGVQGKLPWRPTTPTVVWALLSMPGSEVRKIIQPHRDSGRQRIVGVLQ